MQSRKSKQLQGMKGYYIANNFMYTDGSAMFDNVLKSLTFI